MSKTFQMQYKYSNRNKLNTKEQYVFKIHTALFTAVLNSEKAFAGILDNRKLFAGHQAKYELTILVTSSLDTQ